MQILKRKILLIFIYISSGFWLASLGLILTNYRNLSSEIALKFDEGGIRSFGEREGLWWIMALSGIILAINTILSEKLFFKERNISYLALGANMLFSIILFIATAFLISNN